jgi:hypothetical protein
MPTLHWLTREKDLAAVGEVPYRLLEEVPDLNARCESYAPGES